MFWKRYAVVFGVGLIIANAYAFLPAIADSGAVYGCPVILGPIWFEAQGAEQVVGPPLYSEMQMVMHSGSTAFETRVQRSDGNNLTQVYQGYPRPGTDPVTQYLYQIDGITGMEFQNEVAANQTGVTITFQNITFDGIHIARFLYRIDVSSSARSASYELGLPPCETGLVLTVGSLPYAGPLAYEPVQLITLVISNVVALIGSTVACIALRFYWKRPRTYSDASRSDVARSDLSTE